MNWEEMPSRSQAGLEGWQQFLGHLIVYSLVGALLAVISMETSPDYFWAKWPLLGWGIGLLLHAVNTFVFTR